MYNPSSKQLSDYAAYLVEYKVRFNLVLAFCYLVLLLLFSPGFNVCNLVIFSVKGVSPCDFFFRKSFEAFVLSDVVMWERSPTGPSHQQALGQHIDL
jgi:hypothetical protein